LVFTKLCDIKTAIENLPICIDKPADDLLEGKCYNLVSKSFPGEGIRFRNSGNPLTRNDLPSGSNANKLFEWKIVAPLSGSDPDTVSI
jgi:hypothetical protein